MHMSDCLRRWMVRVALLVVAGSLVSLLGIGMSPAQQRPNQPPAGGRMALKESKVPLCNYPRYAPKRPFASRRLNLMIAASDKEPNDTFAKAQAVPLGFAANQDGDVDLDGKIGIGDVDLFSFHAEMGDIFGAACLSGQLDTVLTVFDTDRELFIENDQHGGIARYYPPESPLPAGGAENDSVVSFVAPKTGTYYVRVAGYGGSTGTYALQLRLRKPPMLDQPAGTKQIVFLDFDGHEFDAHALFGEGGKSDAKLSPMRDFLASWGLEEADHNPLIDSVVAGVTKHFDDAVKTVGNAGAGIVIRNSKDHPNPAPGEANVMRVVIGGTITQFGISTIGLAQYVDPGNFATRDNAVVLLDLLSEPAGSANSINSISLAMGYSKRDAVARVLAVVAAHEIGHLLGCWHCRNENEVSCVMDRGGDLWNMTRVGADDVLSANDPVNVFATDEYVASEKIGENGSRAHTHVRVAYGLSSGTLNPIAFRAAIERDLFQAQLMELRSTPRPIRRPGGDAGPVLDLLGFGGPTPPTWAESLGSLMGGDAPGGDPFLPRFEGRPPSTEADLKFWKQQTAELKARLRSAGPPR